MGLFLVKIFSSSMIFLAIANSVFAQSPSIAKPDRNGDYWSNQAPIQAKQPLNSPGSLWTVVSSRLNCRRHAGSHYRLERQFKRGELLQANVGRGGSDDVLTNARDQTGKPWMFVRSALGENYNCCVRAHNFYIQPHRK